MGGPLAFAGLLSPGSHPAGTPVGQVAIDPSRPSPTGTVVHGGQGNDRVPGRLPVPQVAA